MSICLVKLDELFTMARQKHAFWISKKANWRKIAILCKFENFPTPKKNGVLHPNSMYAKKVQ